MNDDRPRRSDAAAEIKQLPSGEWMVRRLGVVGLGKTLTHACADLAVKEVNEEAPSGMPPVPITAEGLGDVMKAMHPKAL
jgi:hypothetical protein